jgi:AraC family transcriptional regulator, transcriptional activator FtrA
MPIIVKIMPNDTVTATRLTGPLVAALAYDNLCAFEYGIAVEVFGLSRPELGAGWYRFMTVAAEPGPLRLAGGLTVSANAGLDALEAADMIVIPGWRSGGPRPSPELIAALRRAHARGARLVSMCSGVFVLAETGLLDGRRATSHWRYRDEMLRRWPQIAFDSDVLYVDEGDILTSAGSAAGLDLALYIVRRDYGPEVANKVARRLVLPAHRNGGQRQFVERPVPDRADARLSDVIDFMRANLQTPFMVAELAQRAAMSLRTFNRRFVEITGQTPAAWLSDVRVERARELLEGRDVPIEELARLSGFGGAATLRHHFRRRLNVSPTDYRAAFGQARG